MEQDSLKYLVYRCKGCQRLLTRLEIRKIWARNVKAGGVSKPLCPCGSNHISPSNPKWWEELLLPRVWELWWKEVRGHRGQRHELYRS